MSLPVHHVEENADQTVTLAKVNSWDEDPFVDTVVFLAAPFVFMAYFLYISLMKIVSHKI